MKSSAPPQLLVVHHPSLPESYCSWDIRLTINLDNPAYISLVLAWRPINPGRWRISFVEEQEGDRIDVS